MLFFASFPNETALCLLWCRVRRLSFLGGADDSALDFPLTRRGRDRWRLLGMVFLSLLVGYTDLIFCGEFGWLLSWIFEFGRGWDLNRIKNIEG